MDDVELKHQINNYYIDILGREGSAPEIENQLKKIKNNQIKIENIRNFFKNSPEFLKITFNKPIFIIGLQRGGTTILNNIMSNHEELCWIAAIDNKKIFSNIYLEKQKLKLSLDRKMGKRVGGEIGLMFYGKEDIKKNITWNKLKDPNRIPVEGVHIWDKYFGRDFNAKVTPKSLGIKEFISSICEEQKKKRFLSKSPENIKRLDAIKSIFPDALFVCIVRNPFACVSSRIVRGRREGKIFYDAIPTLNASIDKMSDVEYASLNLKQNLEMIFEFKEKDNERFYLMFYEDLIQNTKSELEKLLDFLQLTSYDEFFQNLPSMKNMNEKWKETLTDDEIKIVSNTLSETVKTLNLPYDLK